MKKETDEKEMVTVVLNKDEQASKFGEVSAILYRTAEENLKADFLRIWWCNKYKIPPTDPRYGAYTQEQLMIEFLEDAIDKDLVRLSEDGMDVDNMDLSGLAGWDDEIERLKTSRTFAELTEEDSPKEVDILDQIDAALDAEHGKGIGHLSDR